MTRFQHYQKYQTWYEIGLLALFMILNSIVLSTTVIMDAKRGGEELPFRVWEPFVWEFSSTIATMLLVPGIVWLLNSRYSSWHSLRRLLFVYFIASIIYSVLHVSGMVAMREFVYWTQGLDYDFGNVAYEFFYEYRKDLISFILLIGILLAYRFIMNRLQGEANIVQNGEDDDKPGAYDRILVKKLGKEFIVKISDIEWLESSGNYVNLHVEGRIYPTRNTLSKLVDEIADKGFCRVHRSYAVNLDAVDSIEPQASGSSELFLKTGKVLTLSRRYHEELKRRLQ